MMSPSSSQKILQRSRILCHSADLWPSGPTTPQVERGMRAWQSWTKDLCAVEDTAKNVLSREDKAHYSKDSRSG